MSDLHVAIDSLIGYLVGMTFVEVILKPLLVKSGMKLIRVVDRDASVPDWVIPDFLYEDLAEESESE